MIINFALLHDAKAFTYVTNNIRSENVGLVYKNEGLIPENGCEKNQRQIISDIKKCKKLKSEIFNAPFFKN